MIEAGVPVVAVVSDRRCAALEVASEAGIATALGERDRFDQGFDRDEYSARLAGVLDELQADLVAMAGFGTILTEPMHQGYGGRILNTHPALLPAFKGWHAVRDALEHGVKVTGCTVHLAGLDVDTGQILAQEAVPVLTDDTEESLSERIKQVERRLYPETLLRLIETGQLTPLEPTKPEGTRLP